MTNIKKELYISVDIEADGPIPGAYSMNSLGAVVAGYKTSDNNIVAIDVTKPENGFYTELKPISEQWNEAAFAISKLNREDLILNGEDPTDAMLRFNEWVENMKVVHSSNTVIFVAFPLGFDWLWTYWYLMTYAKFSPFGHGRHADIKTLYAEKSKSLFSQSAKARMPKFLKSKLPHTHNARDDAAEQGELFMNLLKWNP